MTPYCTMLSDGHVFPFSNDILFPCCSSFFLKCYWSYSKNGYHVSKRKGILRKFGTCLKNILFFLNRSAGIKSFRKTPDVIFDLITNNMMCQRTHAQVRICLCVHERCDRGSARAPSCSTEQRRLLPLVQQIHLAPGSNENRHNSRVPLGGQVQRWPVITIKSVDVGSCLAESVHDCGRALEEGSKMQGRV